MQKNDLSTSSSNLTRSDLFKLNKRDDFFEDTSYGMQRLLVAHRDFDFVMQVLFADSLSLVTAAIDSCSEVDRAAIACSPTVSVGDPGDLGGDNVYTSIIGSDDDGEDFNGSNLGGV